MTKKLKVLAVDDESINRLILEELLIHDYELISLSSGKECLDYLQKCPQVNGELPFLILLDVGMPDTSGLEVCKKIKRGMKTKQIQIVFISSLGFLSKFIWIPPKASGNLKTFNILSYSVSYM